MARQLLALPDDARQPALGEPNRGQLPCRRPSAARLVKTVGVLVAVIGATLLLGARRPRPEPEVAVPAAGSAAGLGAIDVIYALRGRIARIYLLDALAEAAIVTAWLVARAGRRRHKAVHGGEERIRMAGVSRP